MKTSEKGQTVSKWVVVVPGIMGSSLTLDGREVWPPRLWDVISGYDRIDDLIDSGVRVGEIISSVATRPVYRCLLEDLETCGYQVGDAERRLIEFPYDWRRSNTTTADLLATRLDEEFELAGPPADITFVAHSMGGLVVRRLLEGGDYADRTWADRVSRLITLGTPHFGAPLAISRLTGRERVLGVSGTDIVRLASDPRYSSAYELAGPPDTAFITDIPPRGHLPSPLDRLGAEVAQAAGLTAANVAAANTFWSNLGLGRRPSHVEYFFVGGAAHKTTTGCASDGVAIESTVAEKAGDGTVPIASALVATITHMSSGKSHNRIFEDRDVRESLYTFLDAPVGVTPQAADDEPVGQPGAVGLSVDQFDYLAGDPIEIVLSYTAPIDQPVESLWLERLHEESPPVPVESVQISLDAPSVSNFVVTIAPDLDPGVYQLTTSRHTDDPQPTIFRVLA